MGTTFSAGDHHFDLVASLCPQFPEQSDVLTGGGEREKGREGGRERREGGREREREGGREGGEIVVSQLLLSVSLGYNSVSRFIIEELPDQRDEECPIVIP